MNTQGHKLQHYIDVVKNYWKDADIREHIIKFFANVMYQRNMITSESIDYLQKLRIARVK